MKKRIISMIAAIAAATTCAGTSFAAEIPEKVEISFKVGDNILSINGNDVSVEKPFIAGDGVTMVPLRVITEAFGAEVEWNGEARSITITYPDVTLGFVIDSKSVKVNDHTETLEEAPVILGDGTTMVPLRFISETFGAEVGWDSATGGITVTKVAAEETGSTIQVAIDKEYITDSYYGWSMKNPNNFNVDEISTDCRMVYFTNETTWIYIDITPIDEEDKNITLDKIVSNSKTYFSDSIISKATKATNSNGDQYAVTQCKDSDGIYAIYTYIKNDCYYDITIISEPDDKDSYNEAVEIAETFILKSKTGNNVEDISNVKDGIRHYKNTSLGIEFDAPAAWYEYNNEEDRIVVSADAQSYDNSSYINAYFFSKGNGEDIKESAQRDRDKNEKNLATNTTTVSEVKERMVDGKPAYYYTCDIVGTKYSDMKMYDLFVENGDYIINFTVEARTEDSADADAVINSIKLSDIDSEAIGTVMRTTYSDDLILDYSVGNVKVNLPERWIVAESGDSNLVALEASTGSSLAITSYDYDNSISASRMADELHKFLLDSLDGAKTVQMPAMKSINGQTHYVSIIEMDTEEALTYVTTYMFVKKGNFCVVTVTCGESMNREKVVEDVETIIKNMEW